jgi:hypothetical protein
MPGGGRKSCVVETPVTPDSCGAAQAVSQSKASTGEKRQARRQIRRTIKHQNYSKKKSHGQHNGT